MESGTVGVQRIVSNMLLVFYMVCGLLSAQVSLAEYNQNLLGSAAGGYLVAVDLLAKTADSECQYMMKGKARPMSLAINEVRDSYMPADKIRFNNTLASRKWKEDLRQNSEMVAGYIEAGIKDNVSMDVICASWMGLLSGMYAQYEAGWIQAKALYSK